MFVDIGKVKSLWLVEVELYGCYLPRSAEGVFGDEVYFWSVECGFAEAVGIIFCSFFDEGEYVVFCLCPLFWRAEVFFLFVWIVAGESDGKMESKGGVERVDDVPDEV